jgi:virginiamycin B lyase
MDGEITDFSIAVPGSHRGPRELAAGPDGAIWISELRGNAIARLTPDGQVTRWPLATKNSWPFALAFDHKGVLWFSELMADQVGRLEIIN